MRDEPPSDLSTARLRVDTMGFLSAGWLADTPGRLSPRNEEYVSKD